MATDEAIPNEALSPYGTFVAAGYNIPKNEDVELELDGEWVKSKYGLQFGVKSCIPTLPETEEGIIAFLSSGALPYIKNKTAVKMYSMYGNDIFRIIKEEPEKLLAFRGINKKRLTAITNAFVVNYGYGELVMFLSPFGVSINKIRKIVDTYGAKATEIVKTNPYNLFRVKGFGFQTVDQIAQKVHTPLNDPLRIEGAIEYVLSEQQSKGNLCMEQTKLLVDAYGFLNGEEPEEVVSKREIIDVIKDLALNGRLCGDNGYAYLPHNYKNEVFAAEKVSALLAQKGNTIGVRVEKEITKFESENFKLAVNQSAAIRQFFDNNFSIVTGGPGTGKSTVLKAILTIQNRLFPDSDVLLCAPTGRAARRMSEATEHSASTIHSAFCIREGTKVDDMEKTAADVVIIDEVSMCDQKLFSLVLAAIDPRRTKLLLVGDSDQLPSVGAGNVLDELISCGKVPYTRLNLVYRQGKNSVIPINADKINKGESKLSYRQDEFSFIEADDPELCLQHTIYQYIAEVDRVGIENTVILCPMKSRGINCVAEYNKRLQEKINPQKEGKAEITVGKEVFRIRDRVMQTKNSENVSNGETGTIIGIAVDDDNNKVISILFDGRDDLVTYYEEDMRDITLAYAITIHKSQGSEYKSIVMPLLKSFYIMLKRNLIYTAVTRAKEKVIIVGQRPAIHQAVKKDVSDIRLTQLGRRIAAPVITSATAS